MWRSDFIYVLKYLIKPRRLVDLYYYFKEYKKALSNNTTVKIGVSTKGSVIGDHCVIASNSSIIDCQVGRRTNIKNNCNFKNAIIGKYCVFAENVQLGAGIHPVHFVTTNYLFYATNKSFETFADKQYFKAEYAQIEVGNDVWFGAKSTVLGNVKIGCGAVIAYGAVVTKDVPPYSICAGIPARVVKMRFPEEIIKRLLEIQWWDLSEDFLKKHCDLMCNPESFINYYDANKAYVESFREGKSAN